VNSGALSSGYVSLAPGFLGSERDLKHTECPSAPMLDRKETLGNVAVDE
jgi:hypothetical protein